MAKKKTTKKAAKQEETKPIGIKSVPLTDIETFEKLKKELSTTGKDLTASELFSKLVNNVSGDTKQFADEISVLHDEISRINKESGLKDIAITELENKLEIAPAAVVKDLQPELDEANSRIENLNLTVDNLIKAIGTVTYTDAIEKAIALNNNTGNDSLQPQIDLLTGQLVEKDNIIEELTDEITTMKTELSNVKENQVTLEGKQFVADVNEENHSIIHKYLKELYSKKIISGNTDTIPNEVMNWAIKKAMQVTFGKL